MNNKLLSRNINIRMDYILRKINYKLFVASTKGIMTIKYKLKRVKIGSTLCNYKEDTRFLECLVSNIESKGYNVIVDDDDLAHYHVLYISFNKI